MKKPLLLFTLIFVCLSLQSQSIQSSKLKVAQWGKQKVVTCSNQDFSIKMVAKAQRGQQKRTKIKQLKIQETPYELVKHAGLIEIRDKKGATYLRTNASRSQVSINNQLYHKNTKGSFGKKIEYRDANGKLFLSGSLSHGIIKIEAYNMQISEAQYLLALCFEELMQKAWDAYQTDIMTAALLITY